MKNLLVVALIAAFAFYLGMNAEKSKMEEAQKQQNVARIVDQLQKEGYEVIPNTAVVIAKNAAEKKLTVSYNSELGQALGHERPSLERMRTASRIYLKEKTGQVPREIETTSKTSLLYEMK